MNVNVSGLFSALLATLFIWLKLTGQVTWSWLWVLAPVWIPAALALAILAIIGIAMLIVVVRR